MKHAEQLTIISENNLTPDEKKIDLASLKIYKIS